MRSVLTITIPIQQALANMQLGNRLLCVQTYRYKKHAKSSLNEHPPLTIVY